MWGEDVGDVQHRKPHVTGAPAEVPWGSEPTSTPDLEEVAQKILPNPMKQITKN